MEPTVAPVLEPPNSYPNEPVSSSSDPPPSDDLVIALRKGKRTFTYPISSYVSYSHLSSSSSHIASLDSVSIP